ncbi:jg22703 [Pararge aegeria aegeria]|uniref:Jg22703 protein n=1 Tax=Pararge aegeria aegeria TaxID=348720 RepID=A0A8S4RM38_9NEOP|nr:jg22703 [Pararge aegeria aegeria]
MKSRSSKVSYVYGCKGKKARMNANTPEANDQRKIRRKRARAHMFGHFFTRHPSPAPKMGTVCNGASEMQGKKARKSCPPVISRVSYEATKGVTENGQQCPLLPPFTATTTWILWAKLPVGKGY